MRTVAACLAFLLATTSVCAAQPAASAPTPALPTTPMQVDQNDLAIFATAIHLVAGQCGADHETACQIGMNEKAEVAKLNAASDALKAQQAATKPKDK